jgi:DNA-binding NarL/FixJ family response regulator
MDRDRLPEVRVIVFSQDPFFLFGTRGLLGRDRGARICAMPSTLPELNTLLDAAKALPHALICDVDSTSVAPGFYPDLRALLARWPMLRVLCLAEARLEEAVRELQNQPVRALLSKADLGYALHLALRAIVASDVTLLTPRSHSLLDPESRLRQQGRTIAPRRDHPNLTARLAEVVMWRIFIGLDNPDIQDELLLGKGTVREYVSKAYEALGVKGELEAFEAMSDWWWVTRFARIFE